MNFTASKSSSLEKLDYFLSKNITKYENGRNFDFGPQNQRIVSCLSPYITHRVLSEYDIIKKVISMNTSKNSEKFVQEIFWRIYWRGWLETHSEVWTDFVKETVSLDCEENYNRAVNGETKIDFFNSWVKELKNENYLHNHTRMWFASIWIFTLKLPWQLGAAFFLKHLLDGDSASNTLSWRWVAGLHTKGKNYLAKKWNIEKFSNIAVKNIRLNETAKPLFNNKTYPFKLPECITNAYNKNKILLIFDNELNNSNPKINFSDYKQIFLLILDNSKRQIELDCKVLQFKRSLQLDFQERLKNSKIINHPFLENICKSTDEIDVLYPFIGENYDYLNKLKKSFGTNFNIIYNEQDLYCWKFANKGYFNFKKNSDTILNQIG
ncbi:MAG: DNA photolyase [Rhodobacteraceae bacterium]|nr:MAG: DNA photolyase [Paracoccaceae bacterium]